MPENSDHVIDQRLVRVVAHPLRVEVLEAFIDQGELSPSQIAEKLGGKVGNVSYHVNVLRDCEVVELVRTEQRRGAVEHFFRPAARAQGFIEAAKKTLSSDLS